MTPPGTARVKSGVLQRTAIFLLAVAQLCLSLVAFSEGRYGADARAHVEAAGTSAHHAHDEAGCAACTARALLSGVPGSARISFDARDRASAAPSKLYVPLRAAALSGARPRAPPVSQA